jgi:hypothetical protein
MTDAKTMSHGYRIAIRMYLVDSWAPVAINLDWQSGHLHIRDDKLGTVQSG